MNTKRRKKNPPKHHLLDDREHATVIAALNCYYQVLNQCHGDLPDDLADLATNGATLEPLDYEEIDELIVCLNTKGTDAYVLAAHLLVDAMIKGELNQHSDWNDVEEADRMACDALGKKEVARKKRAWKKALR